MAYKILDNRDIDLTYTPGSENAQSGKAVAEAVEIANTNLGYIFEEGFIDNGGKLNADSTRKRTGFILCNAGDTIEYIGESQNQYINVLSFYDKNRKYLSGLSQTGSPKSPLTATAPENCAYVRLSALNSQKNAYISVKGATIPNLRKLITENESSITATRDLTKCEEISFDNVGYLSNAGNVTAQSGYVNTDFIICAEDIVISATGLFVNNQYGVGIAFYDKYKKFISGFKDSNEIKEGVIAPNGTAFVRFSKEASKTPVISLDKSVYAEYVKNVIVGYDNNYLPIIKTANLFNAKTVQPNKYTDGNGGLLSISNASYNASDYIYVKENTNYICNQDLCAGSKIQFFDRYKKFISSPSGLTRNITTPSHCAYIQFTVNKPSTFMFVEGDTLPEKYIGYTDYLPLYEVENRLTAVESLVSTKNTTDKVEANDLSTQMKISTSRVKYNYTIGFHARVETLGTLQIGKGFTTGYSSGYIKINDTTLSVHGYTTAETTSKTINHGLIIEDEINVIIKQKAGTATITISSKGNSFTTDSSFNGSATAVMAQSEDGVYSDCSLTFFCEDYEKPVWAFGDSYFDMYPSKIYNLGYTNWLVDGLSGSDAASAYNSLVLSMQKQIPKKILWCMGMNNRDSDTEINSSWLTNTNLMLSLCETYGIEPILCTIPNIPERNHSIKNEWIRQSGYRYVDVCEALGADLSTSWYDGLLSTDNVHPTSKGSTVIAQRIIADVPELMENVVSTSSSQPTEEINQALDAIIEIQNTLLGGSNQ